MTAGIRRNGLYLSSGSGSGSDPLTLSFTLDTAHPSAALPLSSEIFGDVVINVPDTTKTLADPVVLTSLSVYLLGRVNIQDVATYTNSVTKHSFLELEMPIRDEKVIGRTMMPGEEQAVPYYFVLPESLATASCLSAKWTGKSTRDHQRLPPSMGGRSWDKDDLAPRTIVIEYMLVAKATCEVFSSTKSSNHAVEASLPLKVLPNYPPQPPLPITRKDKLYCLNASEKLRKSRLGSKYGRLMASTYQPPALVVDADDFDPSSFSVPIDLRFFPSTSEAIAPETISISAKLSAITYFSPDHMSSLPNLHSEKNPAILTRVLEYTSSIPLIAASVAKVDWQQNTLGVEAESEKVDGSISRRKSSLKGILPASFSKKSTKSQSPDRRSESSEEAPSSAPAKYFFATLDVPLALPKNDKTCYLPSFHSCLVSRVYVLHISLSPDTNLFSSNAKLALPIEVAAI